jgi:aspartate/methionine/tyrosine aminotransferase
MMNLNSTVTSALSDRGERLLADQAVPEYLQEHFRRSADPGYIPLCVAENRLMWDLIEAKATAARAVPSGAFAYDAMIGGRDFRSRLARFMGRTFLGREFAPEQVAVLSGAGSVLEILFYLLADSGDAVLVPTPSYAGFWMDLGVRDGLQIVPVHRSAKDGFRLTPALLDRALAAADRPVRALLFTSPDNPLGTVYAAAEIDAVVEWAAEAGIHVVFDEIYALSVFGERPFTSVAALRSSLGEGVHIVWAFSKDFAASGLRCGVLVSENERLLAAVDGLAYWACCSGDTQYLLGEMVSDAAWVDGYVATMQRRLGDAYRAVAGALTEGGIPFVLAGAGFFVLLDLRGFLRQATWEAEHALWRRLLDQAGVNLTPGAALRAPEPGFARLCFAGVPTGVALEGVFRMARMLR